MSYHIRVSVTEILGELLYKSIYKRISVPSLRMQSAQEACAVEKLC